MPFTISLFAAALLAGPAHAAALDDQLSLALQALTDGDFPAAEAALDEAEQAATEDPSIVNADALAAIYYYRGIMTYYGGGEVEDAVDHWRSALEKADLWWDSGLVADREGENLYTAIRDEVRSRPQVPAGVTPNASVATVYIDGGITEEGDSVLEGTHLVQVRCADGSIAAFWHTYGVAPQFHIVCPEVVVEATTSRFRSVGSKVTGKIKGMVPDRVRQLSDDDLVALARNDPEPRVRYEALEELQKRGAEGLVDVAIHVAVVDADAGNRRLALSILEQSGTEPAASAIATVFGSDPDPDVRRKAAIILRKRWPCRQIDMFARRLTEEKHPSVFSELTLCLATCDRPEDRAALYEQLKSNVDPRARGSVAYALGKANPKAEDTEPLIAALDDPIDDPAVRAAWALVEVGDQAQVGLLRTKARTAPKKRAQEFERAAEALAERSPSPGSAPDAAPAAPVAVDGFTPPTRDDVPPNTPSTLTSVKADHRWEAVARLEYVPTAIPTILWVLFTDGDFEVRFKAWRVVRARARSSATDAAELAPAIAWLAVNGEDRIRKEAMALQEALRPEEP